MCKTGTCTTQRKIYLNQLTWFALFCWRIESRICLWCLKIKEMRDENSCRHHFTVQNENKIQKWKSMLSNLWSLILSLSKYWVFACVMLHIDIALWICWLESQIIVSMQSSFHFMVKLFICCGSIVMKLCTVNGTAWINHIKHPNIIPPPLAPLNTAPHHPLLPRLDSLLYLSIKKETHYQWFNQ